MFKGFNLETSENFEDYLEAGKGLYKNMEKLVQKSLDEYVLESGELDGSKIQKDWFPQINADIFISHSHNDVDLAIGLAGFFYTEFGLTVFIDSCIWGYADILLQNIDNKYCFNDGGKTYNYTKRNFSSSHVHMMLSTALNMMIDKTECIVFLNTPNSISKSNPKEIIKNETSSPWIYSEIVMTDLIRKKDLLPERMEKLTIIKSIKKYVQDSIDFELNIKYNLGLMTHLAKCNDKDLNEMKAMSFSSNKKTDNLDNLYKIKHIENIKVKELTE